MAVKAYNKALEQGMTRVMRVPIMLIGQERSGKTSLKKSLKGHLFNDKEESTDGIEKDPNYFSITTEIWSTGEKDQQPDSESAVTLHHRVARLMVNDFMGKGEDAVQEFSNSANMDSTSNSKGAGLKTTEIHLDTDAPAEDVEQTEPQSLVEIFQPKHDEEEFKKKQAKEEVPNATAARVEKLLKEFRREEDKVYSILWDFGGQSVYYATHPLFLTGKAVYLLVHDVSKNPHDKATPITKQGTYKQKEDHHCRKTNEEYLHFWLSSVFSLVNEDVTHAANFDSGKLSKRLPPVILVCTHADKCVDARELASEIYGSLRCEAKPYSEHLSRRYFVVDNTKSGSGRECPDIQHLRNEVLEVAKQLPQMKQSIPIKWLHFEEELKHKVENGEPFISLDEARKVASDECGIDDDQQFDTLLNFLHDQRILIHFDDTPELNKVVILDLQWLIDLFRKVITVKRYDPKADEEQFEELWKKLETDGILDDELLQIVWRPLLNKETTESLIAVMEKFSLLCHWPSMEKRKQYLVPSMLMSHPNEVATKLLTVDFIPPLFLRFRQTSPVTYSCSAAEGKSVHEYVQVPLGLFPRLVVKFFEWCIEKGFRPLYKQLYQNLARFPIQPKGYSVILLCHSTCIEIVIHRDPDSSSDTSKVDIGGMVRRQLESMLERLRAEFFWLKTMEYDLSVLCPVCCKQCSVTFCQRHQTSGCEKEGCLHFWSESELELQDELLCGNNVFAEFVEVNVEVFIPWFDFLELKVWTSTILYKTLKI